MNADTKKSKHKLNLARIVPLGLLVIGFSLFFYFDGVSYIGLDRLKEQRDNLTSLVERLGIFAPILYGVFYAVVVAFSLPLGSIMTLTAGFLFGIVVGTTSVVLGATIGASLLFIAIQMGFGKSLGRGKEGGSSGWMTKMQAGFKRNAFSYLLVLRLVPVFPFALVNIAAALVGMPLSTYFFGTLFGIIPGTFVYILIGNGLGAIFDAGGTPNLSIIFEPQIIAPILGLAGLVLLQVAYRYVQDKKKSQVSGSGKAKPASAKKKLVAKPTRSSKTPSVPTKKPRSPRKTTR
ncbi:MAG: TVP38/TMEM64 family protein [Candidatus Portiera sp.]|nr:TVP38/TMEM64 family protein [Portiera sp.]